MSVTFRKNDAMVARRQAPAASPCVHEARAAEAADVAPGLSRHGRAEFSLRAVGQGEQGTAIQACGKSGRKHQVAREPPQARESGGVLPVEGGPMVRDGVV